METSENKQTEKMKLMLELGMEEAAAAYAEAKGITSLKFVPITREKIDSLLQKEYERVTPKQLEPILGGYLFAVGGVVLTYMLHCSHSSIGTYLLPIIFEVVAATMFHDGYPHKVRETAWVEDVALEDWEWDLPYGALLAVKEAKSQGFKKFKIYYPIMRTSKRLKSDPIIVGKKNTQEWQWREKMYNIFAWDDGKIYE